MNQQDERLIKFRMKLEVKHVAVRTNILMMMPLPSISTTYNLLIQDEKQREITDANIVPSMALTAIEDKKNELIFVNRGKPYSNPSPTLGYWKKLNSFYCNHCKMPCHSIERCWRVHSYPPKHNNAGGKYNKGKKFVDVVYGDDDTTERTR